MGEPIDDEPLVMDDMEENVVLDDVFERRAGFRAGGE